MENNKEASMSYNQLKQYEIKLSLNTMDPIHKKATNDYNPQTDLSTRLRIAAHWQEVHHEHYIKKQQLTEQLVCAAFNNLERIKEIHLTF